MPILTYDALDSVPDGLREYAKQNDGSDKFVVNVVAASRVDEFRDNNITISKERDELVKTLAPYKQVVGDDLEAFEQHLTELRNTAQRVKDGDLKESRGIEEAVNKRTDEMRKSFEDRLQAEGKDKVAWQSRYSALDSKFRQGLVASAVKDACVAEGSGVDPTAINAVIREAHDLFRVGDDGKLSPMAGDAPIYGADGVSPMTPKEWLVKLKEDQPFFFKSSNGGGAGGNGGPGGRTHLGRTPEQMKALSGAQKLALANGEKVI